MFGSLGFDSQCERFYSTFGKNIRTFVKILELYGKSLRTSALIFWKVFQTITFV